MTKFVKGSISMMVNNKKKNQKEVVEESESEVEEVQEEDNDDDDEDDDEEEDDDVQDEELLKDLNSDEEENDDDDDEDDEELEEDDDDEEAQPELPKSKKRQAPETTSDKNKTAKKQKSSKAVDDEDKPEQDENNNENDDEDDDDDEEKPKKEEKKKHPRDNSEKLARTLFVGNLPHDFDKKEFKKKMNEFGQVASFRVRSIAPAKESLSKKVSFLTGKVNPNKTTVNAYVVFKSADAISKALVLNNTEWSGHVLRVDRCDGNRKFSGTDRTIFVGNVSIKATENDLRKYFSECGEVTMVRIIRDRNSQACKGFAYVAFATRDGYKAAMERNGQELMSRAMRISQYKYTKPKDAPNGRRSFEGTQGRKPNAQKGKKPNNKPNAGKGKAFLGETAGVKGVKRPTVNKEKKLKAKIAQKKKLSKVLTGQKA